MNRPQGWESDVTREALVSMMPRFACLLLILSLSPALAEKVSVDDARSMVTKALPFLRTEADAWIEDRGCVTCHQVPFGIWSHAEARRLGFPIDDAKLDEWIDWSVKWESWMNPKRGAAETTTKTKEEKESEAVAANVDTMAQLILALADPSAELSQPWADKFRKDLVGLQKDAGSWRACGQLPLGRRPARETQEVTTMWVRLALKEGAASGSDWGEKSAAWLSPAQAGLSTEWWAAKLLDADETGRSKLAPQLLGKQRPGGGWGWLTDEPSNALGTGQALYALGKTGVSWNDPQIQRALSFLHGTQTDDGSWEVPSTRKKDQLKVRETSTYFGTAWAVIGVLALLPEPEATP